MRLFSGEACREVRVCCNAILYRHLYVRVRGSGESLGLAQDAEYVVNEL